MGAGVCYSHCCSQFSGRGRVALKLLSTVRAHTPSSLCCPLILVFYSTILDVGRSCYGGTGEGTQSLKLIGDDVEEEVEEREREREGCVCNGGGCLLKKD